MAVATVAMDTSSCSDAVKWGQPAPPPYSDVPPWELTAQDDGLHIHILAHSPHHQSRQIAAVHKLPQRPAGAGHHERRRTGAEGEVTLVHEGRDDVRRGEVVVVSGAKDICREDCELVSLARPKGASSLVGITLVNMSPYCWWYALVGQLDSVQYSAAADVLVLNVDHTLCVRVPKVTCVRRAEVDLRFREWVVYL